MWKRLWWIVPLAVALVWTVPAVGRTWFREPPNPVRHYVLTVAAITVTYTPVFFGATPPGAFAVTRVSDAAIRVDWTPAAGQNTTVRVKWGEPPASMIDGFQVYYGPGNTVTDNVSLDSTMGVRYYRAWSFNGTDWSTSYAEGNWGQLEMEALAQAILTAAQMLVVLVALLVLALLALLAWWRAGQANPDAIGGALFALNAGLGLFVGIYTFVVYGGNLALAVALTLVGYAVVCLVQSYRQIFAAAEEEV